MHIVKRTFRWMIKFKTLNLNNLTNKIVFEEWIVSSGYVFTIRHHSPFSSWRCLAAGSYLYIYWFTYVFSVSLQQNVICTRAATVSACSHSNHNSYSNVWHMVNTMYICWMKGWVCGNMDGWMGGRVGSFRFSSGITSSRKLFLTPPVP